MPIPNAGMQRIDGQLRQYFHSSGSVTLEVSCFMSLSDCAELPGLLSDAEVVLMGELGSEKIRGILPWGGDCMTQPITDAMTGRTVEVASCFYEPGTALSLTRMSAEETSESMHSVVEDPEVKKMLKDFVRSEGS